MSSKERCGSMHLCTYMSTEKKTRFYTRLLPSACNRWWQSIRQSHGDKSQGEQKAGDEGSGALTFIHSSWGQSAWPQDESCRVQNTTVHRALFSIRLYALERDAQRCSMSVPRSLDSRDPRGNLALRPSRGREEEEHRVPTGRGPQADCPAIGVGGGAAATHANSPHSAGRGFPLLPTFFYTLIFYVIFLHCNFLLL